MLCTICHQRLDAVDHSYIWRTVELIKKGDRDDRIQWAKLPIHHHCIQASEQELMSAKIRLAAGIPSFMYSVDRPKSVDEIRKFADLDAIGAHLGIYREPGMSDDHYRETLNQAINMR